MADNPDYYDYLLQRSFLGLVYRKYILYPKVAPWLTGHALDVGCGIGDMLRFRPGTVGTDINARNVAHCRQNGLEAHEMAPDVLPFADDCFDSVILDNVLEHIAEPSALLSEVRRVLRGGGRFVVGVPGQKGFASDDDHKVFYDETALSARVESAGFVAKTLFHTPVRSAWLDTNMRQYCVYGVFTAV